MRSETGRRSASKLRLSTQRSPLASGTVNLFIIESAVAHPYLDDRSFIQRRLHMKKISSVVMASAIALSMLAFGGQDSAKAGPIIPPGHDCIQYDEGGTDCSFTTYSQCEATASGLAAECYGSPVQDDQRQRWNGETRGSHRVAPSFASPAW